jgi:fumarate reductase flavoprotein subunit
MEKNSFAISDLSRRTFVKGVGAATAVAGIGPSGSAWAQNGGATPIGISGKTIDVDLAAVGGGCAGLAAAATAAIAGLKVAVFEKQGNVASGGNGPFAVESRLQRERRLTYTVREALDFYMKHTHYRADGKLIKAYLSKSASTIDWFESMGINFVDVIAYYPGAQCVWHYKDPKGPALTEALAAKLKSQGGIINFETTVKQLIVENGRIAGLVAEDKSGAAVRVKAKAVVLGAGGFGDDGAMVEKYTRFTGYPIKMQSMSNNALTGDGVRMAWEAGAAQSEMWMDAYRSLPAPYSGPGGVPFELGVFRQPILMVNEQGERFVNEEVVYNGAFAGNAVDAQKGRHAYGIFDEDTNRYYEENEWDWILGQTGYTRSKDVGALMKKAIGEGYQHLFMTDSIEELCSKTGIRLEGLRNTLNEYNRACDSGRDELFFKNEKYLKPVRSPKFYAGRFYLNIYGGLGGVKINHKAEALNKDCDVIPGLYTGGNDANSVCAGTYPFYLAGHTSGFAYNTGRIAGENATAYIKALST